MHIHQTIDDELYSWIQAFWKWDHDISGFCAEQNVLLKFNLQTKRARIFF